MRMRPAVAILGVWMLAAFVVSASGVLEDVYSSVLLGGSYILTVTVYPILFRVSDGFRRFVLSLNLTLLTLAQSARVVGGAMLLHHAAAGLLPARFGLPSGLGDFAIAFTAPFVAARASRRTMKIWHWIGLAHLGMSVTLGSLASPVPGLLADPVSSQIISVFPRSLIPTFVGPMLILMHLCALSLLSKADD